MVEASARRAVEPDSRCPDTLKSLLSRILRLPKLQGDDTNLVAPHFLHVVVNYV